MPSSQTMSYKYNFDGIRTQKTFTDNAVKFYYKHDYIVDGAKVVAETITYTTYIFAYEYLNFNIVCMD